MHLSDGTLSPPIIAATSLLAVGTVAYSLRGVKTEDIPKIALTTAVFLVGSTIRIPIGPTSVHLMLTGLIGLIAGRGTPITLLTALTLQLFLFQFGGLTTLGANVLIESLPAMLLGMAIRPRLARAGRKTFWLGFAAGFFAILFSVLLLSGVLIQSNLRFGQGPFSTVSAIGVTYLPIMFVEGVITAFAVRFIMRVRPEIFCDPEPGLATGASAPPK